MADVLTSGLLERQPSINAHVDRTDITKLWVATLEEQLGDFNVHATPHSIINCGAPTGLYDDVRGATAEELFQLSRGIVDDQAEFGGCPSPHAPKQLRGGIVGAFRCTCSGGPSGRRTVCIL
jgi:hypothetical protein